MLTDFLKSIPLFVVTGIAAVTSGTAVSRIAAELSPMLGDKGAEIREARTGNSEIDKKAGDEDDNSSSDVNVAADTVTTTTPTVGVVKKAANTSATFTLAALATHNKPGNCYVAYKSIVYDVSSHPSWSSCDHHGRSGGVDVTAIFPHSTTYFNSLRKVGTLIGNSGGGSTTKPPTSDDSDDDDHEDEDRNRDEHEDEDDDD